MINIKLKDGTQIVTDKVEEDEGFWKITNPHILHVTLTETKQPQVMLAPYMIEPSSSKEVMLNAEDIQAYSGVSLDLGNYYIQVTSGIDLTTKLK